MLNNLKILFLAGMFTTYQLVPWSSAEELKYHSPVLKSEQMKVFPSSGEFVAFSLKAAEKTLKKIKNIEQYRQNYPEIFNLAGINHVIGAVYDREHNDIIIVGKYDQKRQPLTLDDLVVAFRARFKYMKWPLVSIDPPQDLEVSDWQTVRFEGGIKNTQFGADLLLADYTMKLIGLGLKPSGINEVVSYWSLLKKKMAKTGNYNDKIFSRFWFYPILPSVIIRKDVVSIRGLKIGIFNQVLAAEINGVKMEAPHQYENLSGSQFAASLSKNFDKLSLRYPSFSRLISLNELLALAMSIQEMEVEIDLSFFLNKYPVREIQSVSRLKILKQEEYFEGANSSYSISGGVELMAIALKLKSGDVTALKDAVFRSRPKETSIYWSFLIGEWLIPTSSELLNEKDVVPLFTQAVFLQQQDRYDDALKVYYQLLELRPDWDWVYNNRGTIYSDLKKYKKAITEFDKAIEINPQYAGAYINRATAIAKGTGNIQKSLTDLSKAIEINPMFAQAYHDRGTNYVMLGVIDKAIEDYTQTIKLDPNNYWAYYNLGTIYARYKQDYKIAIKNYTKSIEINPTFDAAYANRSIAYDLTGKIGAALADLEHSLQLNPYDGVSLYNRAGIYIRQNKLKLAFNDMIQACSLELCDTVDDLMFSVRAMNGWKAFDNPEAGFGFGFEKEGVLHTFWNLGTQIMPKHAGAPPSDVATLRRISNQSESVIRQQIPGIELISSKTYPFIGRTLVNLRFKRMIKGKAFILSFIFMYYDGVTYTVRSSFPEDDPTTELEHDLIFHFFMPKGGSNQIRYTHQQAKVILNGKLEPYLPSILIKGNPKLKSTLFKKSDNNDGIELQVHITVDQKGIPMMIAKFNQVKKQLEKSEIINIDQEMEKFIYSVGQLFGFISIEGGQVDPKVSWYAIHIFDKQDNKVGQVRISAENLYRIIANKIIPENVFRFYLFE